MVRDAFMQEVIQQDKEPITPFLNRAKDLYKEAGISTILVAGSSGAFFHIADTVIQMDNYRPVDITQTAKKLCLRYPLSDTAPAPFHMPKSRRVMTKPALGAPKRRDYRTGEVKGETERLKVKVMGKDGFSLGKQNVDLRYIEQLIDSEQTAALGMLLKYAVEKLIDEKRTLPEIVEYLVRALERDGLGFCSDGYVSAGYAMPRRQEIYSCFNRYRRQ